MKVALEDVRKMKLELHLLMSQKRSKVSSRGGKSEEACEIVSLVLQQHRNDAGEAEEISLDEVLPGDEAGKVRRVVDSCSHSRVILEYSAEISMTASLT